MSKVWMISGAAIATLIAVAAWAPQPARSSQDLLAKAQSEFASKARDAVIQRRMAQSTQRVQDPIESAAASLPQAAEPVQPKPLAVASLDPVPPLAAVTQASAVAVTPAPIENILERPAMDASRDNVSTVPSAPVADVPVNRKLADSGVTAPPTEAASPESDPVTATTVPAQPPIKQPASSVDVTARHAAAVTRKARRASNPSATGRIIHRPEPNVSIDAMPRSIETLRTHAPEIAAIIRGYLQ
jgi:hypothetical protein